MAIDDASSSDTGYYTIYVPDSASSTPGYIRVGAPDAHTESPYATQWPNATLPGDGVALYTAGVFAVNSNSYWQSTCGESYVESYDSATPGAPLVSAALTHQEEPGLWRTTTYSQSKSLGYTLADNASFGIGMSYAFFVGPNMTNNVTGSLDTSGVAVGMQLFQVQLSAAKLQTTSALGTLAYSSSFEQTARKLTLEVGGLPGLVPDALDKVGTLVQWAMRAAVDLARLVVVAGDALVAAYTAIGVGIGNNTRMGAKSPDGEPVHGFLALGEIGAGIIAGLNAVVLATGILVGVVQISAEILARIAGEIAAKVTPLLNKPKITLDDDGVTLVCGTSSIKLTATGIEICAPQVTLTGATLGTAAGSVTNGKVTVSSLAGVSVNAVSDVKVAGANATVESTLVGGGRATVKGANVMVSGTTSTAVGVSSISTRVSGATTTVTGAATTVVGTATLMLTSPMTQFTVAGAVSSLGDLAKVADLADLAKTSDLAGLAKTSDLDDLASKSDVAKVDELLKNFIWSKL